VRADAWLGALRQRDFALLFSGQAISWVGTFMVPVALSFAVLDRGGTTAQVGWVLGAETVPLVLFLLPAGAVADRVNRRLVMLSADLLRTGAQGVLAGWVIAGRPPLSAFLICEALVGAGTAFFQPALTGLMPAVASPQYLQQANSFTGTAQSVGFLVGPAVAGVVVASAGPGWAIAADAATYAVSAVLLAAMRAGVTPAKTASSLITDLVEGWQAFRSRTWLWVVVAQFAGLGLLAEAPFFVLGAVVAKRSLGGATAWGAVLAANGAGAVLAGLILLRVQPRRPLRVAEAALLTWAIPLAALAWHAGVAVVVTGAFAAGMGWGMFGPLWETTMQRELPTDVLSRASAYDWFGSAVLLPVGYALTGPLASSLGIEGTLLLAAGYTVVSIVVVLSIPSVARLRLSVPSSGAAASR
jgi:MFS family permease